MDRTGGVTILVVDDEQGIRNLLAALLRAAGYAVLTASNGSEALRLCGEREGPIDLVLTDIVMPEMSGPEMVRRLLEARRATRFLFMTGYADGAAQSVLQACGAPAEEAVIAKPFRPAELLERVRSALSARG